jgi:hypothetical protein
MDTDELSQDAFEDSLDLSARIRQQQDTLALDEPEDFESDAGLEHLYREQKTRNDPRPELHFAASRLLICSSCSLPRLIPFPAVESWSKELGDWTRHVRRFSSVRLRSLLDASYVAPAAADFQPVMKKTEEGFWYTSTPGGLLIEQEKKTKVAMIRGPFSEERDALRPAAALAQSTPARDTDVSWLFREDRYTKKFDEPRPLKDGYHLSLEGVVPVAVNRREPGVNYNWEAHPDWIWNKGFSEADKQAEIELLGITEPDDLAEFEIRWAAKKKVLDEIPVKTTDRLYNLSDNPSFNKVHPFPEDKDERASVDNEKEDYPGSPEYSDICNKPDEELPPDAPEEEEHEQSISRQKAAALLKSRDPLPSDVIVRLGIPDVEAKWIFTSNLLDKDGETSIGEHLLTAADKQTAGRRKLLDLYRPSWEKDMESDDRLKLEVHYALLENEAFDALRNVPVAIVDGKKKPVAPELPSPVPGLVLNETWDTRPEPDRKRRPHRKRGG